MKYNSGLKLKGKTILIVEDDFVCSELIKELLIDTQAEILHSLSASKAIDIVIMNPKIDLVIMDIQLPDMSGLQASSSIKGINSKIPIIIQTAYSFESYMKKSQEIGCDCYLLKPVDPQKLYESIKKILQKKSR
jgi:CheY-like chemotaxis protein